jgi:hypothetical protein
MQSYAATDGVAIPSNPSAHAKFCCKAFREFVPDSSDSFYKHLRAHDKLQRTLTATSSSNHFKAVRAMAAASSKAALSVAQTSAGLRNQEGQREFP